VRAGLRAAFETPGVVLPDGLTVLAEAVDGLQAIAEVKAHKPQLLMLDIAMPLSGGAEILADIRRWSPRTAIVVLTGITAPGMIASLLESGVEGMFSKGSSLEELYRTLPLILSGGRHIADEFARSIQSHSGLQQLTSRERQTLNMVIAGKSNREIAALLSISPKTVDKHRTSLMQKLDVHSISELMGLALREGLIDPANSL